MNEGIKKIIENAVFAESVIQECRRHHDGGALVIILDLEWSGFSGLDCSAVVIQ